MKYSKMKKKEDFLLLKEAKKQNIETGLEV